MIQIFLDGRPAVPASNSSIKLTSENSYFTKSASYTYEVQLPLDIPQNRAVFGDIDRLDTDKRERRFSCRLVVDNATLLSGSAHITSVTETAVKIQMLGAEASFNYGNKMDGLYVDELDLGNWYLRTWPDGSYWNPRMKSWQTHPVTALQGKLTTDAMACRVSDELYGTGWWSADMAERQNENLTSGKYPWTACPVVDSATSRMMNRVVFVEDGENSPLFRAQFLPTSSILEKPEHENERGLIFCPHPFVWALAQYVAEATGFTLAKEDNALYTDPFLKKIFILNRSTSLQCRRCMPHWSVNEWWTQIEQTFGVVASVDYESKTMTLRKRTDHYGESSGTCFIDLTIDDFTVDTGDDTQTDISVNNVGFTDFEADPYELLPESVRESAAVMRFNDVNAMREWGLSVGVAALASDYKGTIFDCADGHRFIYTVSHPDAQGAFVEVDKFRPRLTGESTDIDIELKFVPASWTPAALRYYTAKYDWDGHGRKGVVSVDALTYPANCDAAFVTDDGTPMLDIEAVLNGQAEEPSPESDSSPDVLYMAIYGGDMAGVSFPVKLDNGQETMSTFETYRALTAERISVPVAGMSRAGSAYQPESLSLIPTRGEVNLASATVGGGAVVDTRMRHCIKFLYDDGMPDPRALFVIRNRRFVCEKIEADITPDGLSPLYTGYFFPAEL